MNIKIGAKIKELRKDNNITQEQLAEALGVTNQAVSRWESETGYPDIEYIKPIADFFKVTTDYLLDNISNEKYKTAEEPTKANFAVNTLHVIEDDFEIIEQAARMLMKKMQVVITFMNTSKGTETNYLNFLKGVIFTIDGSITQLAVNTYIFTTKGMDVQQTETTTDHT